MTRPPVEPPYIGVRSERKAWARVYRIAQDLLNEGPLTGPIAEWASELRQLAVDMLVQVGRGLHKNPRYEQHPRLDIALARLISRRVYALEYRHETDGQDYRHDMETAVELWGGVRGPTYRGPGQRVLVLLGHEGAPLWEDFPDEE